MQNNVQEDSTVNGDLGARVSLPLAAGAEFYSGFSSGFDFKTYEIISHKTNNFLFNEQVPVGGTSGTGLTNIASTVASPVPATTSRIKYLPLSLHYDGSWRTGTGTTAFGLGLTFNPWFSSDTTIGSGTNTIYLNGVKSLQQITSSTKSSGYWVVLNPSFSRTFGSPTNWLTTIRMDGQWASEPLISPEQFGIGGVNSVRGYHEGEVFGDTGWHFSLDQQTPPRVVGVVYGGTPLTVRGSVYMDYAKAYLLDPQGRPNDVALWGAAWD